MKSIPGIIIFFLFFLHTSLFAQQRCTVYTRDGSDYYKIGFIPPLIDIKFKNHEIPIGGVIYEFEGRPSFYKNKKAQTHPDTTIGEYSCPYTVTQNLIKVIRPIQRVKNGVIYYETSIPGISMTVYVYNEYTGSYVVPGLYQVSSTKKYLPQQFLKITFFREEKEIKEGFIYGDIAFEFIGGYSATFHSSVIQFDPDYRIKISPTNSTCSYKNQTIQLPTASIKIFNEIGKTSLPHHFNLPIQCEAISNGLDNDVHIQLFDALNNSNNSSVLTTASTPSPGSSAPAASGVGIEILKDGSPLPMGTKWKAATLIDGQAAGTVQIPLAARYIQTSATVSPGSVQARATVTLSYP
ncbi:fimbrial protein [Delftia sp. PS-11]|uniref:fimbrial protein n=1 Tax=Delftia sp. PS-11 TaxID=2767222 RepID=UPI002453B0DE|nr:fimbrial protein [Delftia sp. PS-11]KAJ8743607.1 type 1 fimbrial protein [Delftia sp. PS-11]